jgi:hypothetical protein
LVDPIPTQEVLVSNAVFDKEVCISISTTSGSNTYDMTAPKIVSIWPSFLVPLFSPPLTGFDQPSLSVDFQHYRVAYYIAMASVLLAV